MRFHNTCQLAPLLKHTLTLCGWYCKQGNFFPSSLANCFASSWISTDQVVFKERSSETLKFAQRQPYIHLLTTRVKGAKKNGENIFPVCSIYKPIWGVSEPPLRCDWVMCTCVISSTCNTHLFKESLGLLWDVVREVDGRVGGDSTGVTANQGLHLIEINSTTCN